MKTARPAPDPSRATTRPAAVGTTTSTTPIETDETKQNRWWTTRRTAQTVDPNTEEKAKRPLREMILRPPWPPARPRTHIRYGTV